MMQQFSCRLALLREPPKHLLHKVKEQLLLIAFQDGNGVFQFQTLRNKIAV